MGGRVERGMAAARAAAAAAPERLRRLHDGRYGGCDAWSEWSETVALMEGGRAMVERVGCKVHGVVLTRPRG